MKCIFLADAHLRLPGDRNYRALLSFLKSLRGTTDTLFILGDLFEFWIGYPPAAFPDALPALQSLAELRRSGTRIVWLEGNHDFHVGSYVTGTVGATVHRGPAMTTLEGKKLFLCHGDQICPPPSVRLLRLLLHSPVIPLLRRVVPPAAAARIARLLAGEPRSKKMSPQDRELCRQAIRDFALRRLSAGADAVVTAHFHLPFLEKGKGGTLLSLGDWMEDFWYGEWSGGEFSLCRYDFS